MKVVPGRHQLDNPRVSSQQVLDIDFSSIQNPAGTVAALAGFANYSLGYHYRFYPARDLKLLTGASVNGMFGVVYNTQSANNPIATHIDMDLNISAMGIYTLWIKNYPLTCRFQTDIPFAGMLFAPPFGQSYYEIFGLGNTAGTVALSSLHNKFAMRNYFTIDWPFGKFTLRTGYLNSLYTTNINEIQTRYVSQNVMIGLVKEFFTVSRKNLRNNNVYQSAYY
jgi:hypothetical protein